jgi:hypothetical protein
VITTEEIVMILEHYIKRWDKLQELGRKPEEFLKSGKSALAKLVSTLKAPGGDQLLNFRHPYYWAPFVLVGHADLVIWTASERTRELWKNCRIKGPKRSVAFFSWYIETQAFSPCLSKIC